MEGKFKIQPAEIEKPTVEESKTVESVPVDNNYQELLNFFKESDKNGIKVTNEIMEGELNKILGIGVSEFLNEEINNPEIKSIHDHVAAEIEKRNIAPKKSFLEHLRGISANKYLKTLFLSAAMLSQVNQGYAQEKKTEKGDKDKNKTEASTTTVVSKGAEKTYDASKEFGVEKKELKDVSVLNATSSFEIDKAIISKENTDKIINDINSFLTKINSQNFKKFIESEKVLYASSDERATRYGATDKQVIPTPENNKILSSDRLSELEKVIKSSIEKYDFSKSGLTKDEINQIKSIQFKHNIPEKGYTKITELNIINPNTGKIYTDNDVEEIKKNDKVLYEKLMAECRYVKADLMVENKIETKGSMFEDDNFDEWSVYIDISPSTEQLKQFFAKNVEKASKGPNANKPGEIFAFSDKINGSKKVLNMKEATGVIKTMRSSGGSLEKVATSVLDGLNKVIESDKKIFKEGDALPKRIAYVITDEAIQDANKLDELFKAAKTSNTKVEFIIRGVQVDLQNMVNLMDKAILALVKKQILVEEQNKLDSNMESKNEIISDSDLINKFKETHKAIQIKSLTKEGKTTDFPIAVYEKGIKPTYIHLAI